jgi:hypothetical protein
MVGRMAVRDPRTAMLFGLGGALVLALLAIAFLLGRESARTSADPAPLAEAEIPSPPIVEPAEEDAPQPRPDWRALDRGEPAANAESDTTPEMAERIERQANGKFLLTNSGNERKVRAEPQDPQPGPNTTTVSDYFRAVDAVRSEQGAGDPNTFAMGLIKAGLGGSTSGFDQLIDDTKRMELEMKQIRPAPGCEQYHQASIDALAEGRELLDELKTAISNRDIQGLTTMAQRAGELEAKAKSMDAMRAELEAGARP